jgi:cytochrome oxidase assembly protein ShyY1
MTATATTSRRRFWLRPRWVAGHLLVIVLAAAFVALGFWQLARNDQKHEKDTKNKAAYAAPAPALGNAGAEPAPGSRVEATGTYDARHEALLRNRVRGDEGGYDVLTPLVLSDGTAVVVDRGWVERSQVDSGSADLTPPPGPVTVRGTVGATSPLQPDDTVDERNGRLALPRVDVDRIQRDAAHDLRDVYVTAQSQDPAPTNGVPVLPTPPPSDDVNHLEYAFQWFAFALIPLVGWPIVLWRISRKPPA